MTPSGSRRDAVLAVIASIINIDASELKPDILFREELGIDSLLGMQVIAACERHLCVEIDEMACANVVTVGDFLDLVDSLPGS